jgi:hypothetical protein
MISCRSFVVLAFVSLLFFTACGSSDAGSPPPAPVDAGSDVSPGIHGPDSGGDALAADGAPSDAAPAQDSMSSVTGPDAESPDAEAPDARGSDAEADAEPADASDSGNDAAPQGGSVSVLTQHNDVGRTGANLAETLLTTANVNSSQFGMLSCRAVDDQIYTQPLVVTHVNVPGVGTRDLVYVATMNDSVYAFDAADPSAAEPVWTVSLLAPGAVPVQNTDMTGACGGNYMDISGHIGIVGTPVIDPASQTMYLVARTKENGGATFVQRIHALDITTGAERPNSPVMISATVPGTGGGGSVITFDPQKQNQRSALLLQGGVVYVGWSSHCDWGPYHGWLLGYDAQTLQQVVTYNTTPDGDSAGIWMSGQGPAADAAGDIYLATGNGTVGVANDPTNTRNRGQSALRLTKTGGSLDVATWFTPHDFFRLNAGDKDLGSGGMLLIPNTNLALTGGKGSKIYLLDRTAMGGVSLDRTDGPTVQTVPLNAQHLHGSPVYWAGPGGSLVYTWAEYDHLKAFGIDTTAGTIDPVPVAESPSPAPDGMPGGMLSISANGATEGTGILWAYLPLVGDANMAVVTGELHAFDAANINVELWNSQQNAGRDFPGNFAKFTSPTVANGMVYLATFSNALCTYGLLSGISPLGAPTDLVAAAASKTSTNLTWTLHSTTETSISIERKEGALDFASIGTAPAGATTFVDTTGVPFASYAYRIRALGTPAPSAYSNTAVVTLNGGAPAARIAVSGSGQPVAYQATTASAANGTAYGAVVQSGTTHVFTVANLGDAPLNLTLPLSVGGGAASAFVVTTQPSAQVAAGGTTTFALAFAPTTQGPQTATISIANDDLDQSPFTFTVGGSDIGEQVGWWAFNETTGQVASDSSGQGNTGACTGISWVTGHLGNAAAFDGMTSLVQVAEDASLDPYAISIAAWINPVDWNGNRRIVQKGQYDDQYRLLAENGVFKFDIAGVGVITTTLPAPGAWTHVAGTYDGATMRLYVNGTQVASTPATAVMSATPDPLLIGAKTAMSTGGDLFYGMIDEVHIDGRALTQAEITALAQ